jgi:transposase
MKRTKMKRIREILKLFEEYNLSIRKISKALNVSRPVVSQYLIDFKKTGLAYKDIQGLNDDEFLNLLKQKKETDSERYRILSSKFIYFSNELKRKHVTLIKLFEEYKTECPDGYNRTQFFHHFSVWRNANELTMHIEHKAGAKMFVDFTGKKLYITNRITGEKIEAEIFVAILPASHYTFVYAVESLKTPDWINATEKALRFFDGTPQAIVPDCYKSAVSNADKYEPDINPLYQNFADHYNTVILPARPAHPKDKALVENAVRIVYYWIFASLRNQVFYSIQELNQAISIEVEKYNLKKMNGYGLSRKELFEKIEKNELKNLPVNLYETKSFCKATIQFNYHVLLNEDKHYYSVPYEYRRKHDKIKAELFYTQNNVEIYFKNERIAVHKRVKSKNGYTTKPEHMPEKHRSYLEWNPERLCKWAYTIGENVKLLTEKIIESKPHPEQAYKTILGIINLNKHFEKERLDKACKKALHHKFYSYKAVKEMLTNNREDFEEEEDIFSKMNLPLHMNIRGKDYYTKKLEEIN